jgi:signal peptidase II
MRLFSVVAALAFALDQITKAWIRGRLGVGDTLEFLPGLMHLEHVQNFGAAWGVLSGQKWLLIIFTTIVIAAIASSAREICARGRLGALGFGLILGGAVGNLFDRIVFGHVTDFFDLDTPFRVLQTFPVFNIADCALTVGVVLMVFSLLFSRPLPPPKSVSHS